MGIISTFKTTLKSLVKNDENLIFALVFSIFTHYIVTGIMLVGCAAVFLIKKESRRAIFSVNYCFVGVAFCALTALVALVCKNYIGALCSLGAFFIIIIGVYAHTIMTKAGYETLLNICCVGGIIATLVTIIERFIYITLKSYYCKAGFFNSNYLASTLCTIVIICAYKVITRQGNIIWYYSIAAFCAVGMYLSGSMFIWVELLIGVSVLLSLNHKHNLLSIFLILAAFACAIVYFVPDIIPRFSQSGQTIHNRILIWELSLDNLKDSLLFGHGFLSYMHIIKGVTGAYFTTHAHNIILEPLLSFGILGTITLLVFLALYFRRLLICKSFLRHSHINSLILAITAAVLVHGLIDMTMLWIQTGMLYALIMSGVGAEERILSEIRQNSKAKNDSAKEEI